MEQKIGGGSSEHPNLEFDVPSSIIDEDPIDHDKIIGHDGENDMLYTEFEENGSSSPRSNPKSPSTTPESSMLSASPQARGAISTTETLDLNTLNASPRQSPPIQVMRQPSGYDPNRIPSSIFTPKETNDSEWSLASDESLFSIQKGNNSFSLDNGFFISESGKLIWLDDGLNYSCYTPDANKSSDFTSRCPSLPTMVEKAADNERMSGSSNGESGEKEELLETRKALPIDSESEDESSPSQKGLQLPSPSLNVPDEKGASPTEEPLNSDGSAQRTSSFTFPVLAGGSPTKVDAEGSPPMPSIPVTPKGAAETETTPEAPSTTPKAGGNQWFNCFSCFPICC
ncbi:uncharacterized protein LOC112504127 [Cynara cardunculus var. scolymus]|uniref:uncharacterized protein LOC112504127 n=1 Tax=Cynara cardunculus var. scolymus TaxID=59895 RepID=UPI000D62BDC7|nr:uncharacterized protein LOC112504127 [Cynara cardunculus var. scolymus]